MGVPGHSTHAHTRLGRYELLARLATGGMGEIFLARLQGVEGFEKLYVVKRILAHLADDARFRQMLIAEARIASKMSHPNICQVFELGDSEGQLYIVMEYLEGVSLLPLLRRFSKDQAALDLGLVAGIIQQTTDAMNYAHDLRDRDGEFLGIIHRDVTPSNIFLTQSGVAKVLDFGIAKARGASTQTQEGTVKGKYAYMAPEQLKGASIDRRVDVFSLGVVLYEMLALRRLFQRKTDYLTFRAVMEQPIPDIRRYRPDLPDGVADALLRALVRDPNDRFETARQFGTAVLDGLGKRPWSQAEIGDFVCHYFAEELGKRTEQVANVVGRTQVNKRSTMPLLAQPDGDMQESDDDDDGFPSVETDVEGAPPWMPRASSPPLNPLGPQNSGEFSVGHTPPPFGAETTGSTPSLMPLGSPTPGPTPNAPPIVMSQQRSSVWPIVAVAMVVITGGALFLVWQQMQKEQSPAEIKITQEPSARPIETAGLARPDKVMMGSKDETPPPDGSAVEPIKDPVKEAPKKGSGGAPIVKDKSLRTAYDEALKGHVGAMTQCLNDHRDDIPKAEMVLSIKIGPNGHAKNAALAPATVNEAPLGLCIRNVIMAASFPKAAADTDIAFPLRPKNKPGG